MVTHTWGFVKTRPGSPWTKVEVRAERCVCDTAERKKYRRRLSAPILERSLVQLEVGHAVQEDCDHTWEECVNWVKDPSILTAAEWQV